MHELKNRLTNLAMMYEDLAFKEEDQNQKAWFRGLAMGLRRAIIELEKR